MKTEPADPLLFSPGLMTATSQVDDFGYTSGTLPSGAAGLLGS